MKRPALAIASTATVAATRNAGRPADSITPIRFITPPCDPKQSMLLRGREILRCGLRGNLPCPVRENSSDFFRRENRFRIGTGNFAHCDPTDAADERAEQKRDRRERNQ